MTSSKLLRRHAPPLAMALALCWSGPVLAAGPFSGFAGQWRGGGTIQTDAGQEAIRCKARYRTSPGGRRLNIDVDCASDSTKVHILSAVTVHGRRFSGSWEETSRQISGDVSGRIPEPDTFQASMETIGGGLELGARTNGKEQAITITSQGTALRGASIVLRKA